MTIPTRRAFVAASAGGLAGLAIPPALAIAGVAGIQDAYAERLSVPGGFPSQDPELVRQAVGVSHGNFEELRKLLEKQPELAKAAWDWGFGDWETAIGAASHVGHREIAGFLIEHGARPDLFTFAMLGHVDVVRACIEAMPGVQKIPGPHGITLLAHAMAGGDESASVVEYLQSVGGADERPPSTALDEAAKPIYLGEYHFGAGETDRLIVLDRRGSLFIERPGGAARGLTFVGDHTFTPSGAPSVRIVFEVEGDTAQALRIEGYSPQIRAKRI
jgi:hypothetical protein